MTPPPAATVTLLNIAAGFATEFAIGLRRPPGMKHVLVSPSVVGAEVGLLFGTGDFGAPPIAATGRKAAERAL